MANPTVMEAWVESEEASWGPAVWDYGESAYHAALRSALAPQYRMLPAEQLDELVARTMEAMTPEEAESFGSFLKDLGRAVAPIAAQVVPIAAPIVGGAIGGPAGAALGGTLGGLAGQALSGAVPPPRPQPAQPPPRQVPPPVRPPAPVVARPYVPPPPPAAAQPGLPVMAPPVTAASPAIPPSGSAIDQLAAFLRNPALLQSIAGQLLGAVGARTVPVGPNGVPAAFGDFMSALSVLANQAASEAAERFGEAGEAESTAYLRDTSGAFAYDPAVPEERAQALLAHLRAGETVEQSAHGESVGDWFVRAGLVRG